MILHLQTSEERKINGINLIATQNVMIFSSERENRIMLTVGINGSTDIAKSRILQERGKTIQARY